MTQEAAGLSSSPMNAATNCRLGRTGGNPIDATVDVSSRDASTRHVVLFLTAEDRATLLDAPFYRRIPLRYLSPEHLPAFR